MAAYSGNERRREADARIKEVVKEAMAEALAGANLVDGPTHTLHHQFVGDLMDYSRHTKRTALGLLTKGVLFLLVAGFALWVAGHRG